MVNGIPIPSRLAELVALAATFDMLDDAPTVPVDPEPLADVQELAGPQPENCSPAYVDLAVAAERIGVSKSTLYRAVHQLEREGPTELRPSVKGLGGQRLHRQFPAHQGELRRWWEEVKSWGASTSAERGSRSSGATRTVHSGGGPSRTTRRRRNTTSKSSGASGAESGGSLATLARSLAYGPSGKPTSAR